MTESEVVAKVREFIVDNLLYMRPGFVLGDDDRLLEGRILDSMGVVEVLTFLTTEFGIRVPEADIRESNFGSLRAIARYAMESLTATKGA
ncbi:MAG: acyl carrier protein [Gemmatimonadales bacterium]|nr:acyl carrier protein [Gemmatimonadota bacterium]MCC7131799.1 acyl carrier protein [Gemmatimonadales bacterium]MDX2060157.1 acyl carrier protein [Gemmatimonadales bacterium]